MNGRTLVDTALRATLLDDQQVLAPLAGAAGWYAEPGWPEPGYAGTSVIVGHVSWNRVPDVFWNLPRTRPCDEVIVTYSSGRRFEFTVTRSSAESKDAVPHDTSIWDADNPEPLLRLITCDPTTPVEHQHYLGNWVVWATRS